MTSPVQKHQLVVVGAGAAGLTVAFGAASAGIDVALIEAGEIGGDCTWRGCVPSKTVIEAARTVYRATTATDQGITFDKPAVDFTKLMSHVHAVSADIASGEGEARLKEAGVTLYRAFARFADPSTLELDDGRRVSGRKIVLATGGKPRVPHPISQIPHLTTDTLWSMTELPRHLVVVGGGAVGTELAQAYGRLGSQVTIVTDVDRLLPGAHSDASAMVADQLTTEGVDIHFSKPVISAVSTDEGTRLALGDGTVLEASHVLVAIGKDMGLLPLLPENAGIELKDGLPVLDSALRTSQLHIFVCGDAAGAGLTHIAGAQASGVLVNLVSPKTVTVDPGPTRWAVFTDPEVAQVGSTLSEAEAMGLAPRTTRVPIRHFDKAAIDGAGAGFVEVVHSKRGKLFGVTIVGPNAAELANQWVRHIEKNHRITDLMFAHAIYPTMGATNAVVAYEWADQIARKTTLGKLARLGGKLRMTLTRQPPKTAATPPSDEASDESSA